MAHVIRPDGTVAEVKNLGWLLRHSDRVASVHVYETHNGAILQAYVAAGEPLCDGPYTQYVTKFASYNVAKEWVKRPSLRRATVWTYDRERNNPN